MHELITLLVLECHTVTVSSIIHHCVVSSVTKLETFRSRIIGSTRDRE
jgi:hypothetical protein